MRDDIVDLDTLPFPDYTFLEDYKDYSIMISSGRGCPYNCFYCSTKQMWGINWRKRSATSIFNEIKLQAELFKRDEMKCNIGFTARIELVNKGKGDRNKKYFLVIESGSEKMLKTPNRKYTKELVLKKVQLCEKLGINVTTSFMMGIPGEKIEDVQVTFFFD